MKVNVFWLILGLLPMFFTGYCVGDSASSRDLDRMRDRIFYDMRSEVRHQGEMTRDTAQTEGDRTRYEVRWRCR